jgi:uncharacterized protein (TIGR00369 family)
MTPPPDFQAHDRPSPVTDAWQPLFARWSSSTCEIGFILSPQHCNGRGLLHGGVIASLSDNAMGLALGVIVTRELSAAASPSKPSILTTNLSVDFLGASAQGEWICITPRVVHVGGKSGIVDALIHANDRLIARANATFRVLS